MSKYDRRTFLRQLAFKSDSTSASGTGSKSTGSNGNTLVCVFLRGGADMLNILVPYADDAYYKARPTLAIKAPNTGKKTEETAIKLTDFYAFHPKMQPLVAAFKEGRLGMVQAVGTDNQTGSHFEVQDQIEHGAGYGQTTGGGWLGRHLQTRASGQLTPLSAVSLGPTIPESLRSAPAVTALHSLEEVHIQCPSKNPSAVTRALASMYSADSSVLKETGEVTLKLLSRVQSMGNKEYKPAGGAAYPDTEFGKGLREIARLAKTNVGLEVACIDFGGWDTHFFQGSFDGLQAGLIKELAESLAAFDKDITATKSPVTTLVITEFGRRIYENGSLGTDHGRGFAAFAIGNGVLGGKIHGEWPGLKETETELLGPSGLKIKIDYRSVLAEALTNVLGNNEIDKVFPNFRPQKVGLIS